MTWHVGDFGRFLSEDPKYPRFEVISADKTSREVTVWYSGAKSPTKIPLQTFQEDCVNWWHVDVAAVTLMRMVAQNPTQNAIPRDLSEWLTPGSRFSLESPQRAVTVTYAYIKEKFRLTAHSMDVKGLTLQFRRKRMDYASCLVEDPQTLLLVPLKTILDFGRPITTRWDLLRTKDILDLEEELF